MTGKLEVNCCNQAITRFDLNEPIEMFRQLTVADHPPRTSYEVSLRIADDTARGSVLVRLLRGHEQERGG